MPGAARRSTGPASRTTVAASPWTSPSSGICATAIARAHAGSRAVTSTAAATASCRASARSAVSRVTRTSRAITDHGVTSIVDPAWVRCGSPPSSAGVSSSSSLQDDMTGCLHGLHVLGGHDRQVDALGGHGAQMRGWLKRREVEPAARRCGHEVSDGGDPPRPGLRSAGAEHDERARSRVGALSHRRGDRIQQRDQDVDAPAPGLEQEVQNPGPVEHPVPPRRRTRRDRRQHLAVPERCEPPVRAPQVRRSERRLGYRGSAVEQDVDEHVAGPTGRVQAGGRGVPVTGTPARRGCVQQPARQRVLLLGGGEAGDRSPRGELGGDRRLQLLHLVRRQVGGVVLHPPSAGPATVVEGGEGQLSESRARLVAAHRDLRPPHQDPLRPDLSASGCPRGASAGRRVPTGGSCRA